MNSFNDVNGIPATGDEYLQRTQLKENWDFDGFVVSDYIMDMRLTFKLPPKWPLKQVAIWIWNQKGINNIYKI